MPKSPQEKSEYAIALLAQGKTYREVQQLLTERFGSGMSNTTLLKLQYPKPNIENLLKQNEDIEQELTLFKRLYFELAAATKENLDAKNKEWGISFCPKCGVNIREYVKNAGTIASNNLPEGPEPMQPQARYCPACGELIGEGLEFCPFCGVAFGG